MALSDPRAWSAQVQAKGHGLASDEPVALSEQATEMMLMGLRLTEPSRP